MSTALAVALMTFAFGGVFYEGRRWERRVAWTRRGTVTTQADEVAAFLTKKAAHTRQYVGDGPHAEQYANGWEHAALDAELVAGGFIHLEPPAVTNLLQWVHSLEQRGGVVIPSRPEHTDIRVDLLRWGPKPENETVVLALRDVRLMVETAARESTE